LKVAGVVCGVGKRSDVRGLVAIEQRYHMMSLIIGFKTWVDG
jgi:hypothetical protein